MTRLYLANLSADGFGFESAKGRLASRGEDPSDRRLLFGFDLDVQIGKSPAELRGKHRSYCALARCHEAHQEQPGGSLERQIHSSDRTAPICSRIIVVWIPSC